MTDQPLEGGRGIAANAASLMVAELVSKVANFALIVILARGLGPRQYGRFAFALAFLPLFLHLARWGIDVASLRRVSARPEEFSPTFANAAVVRVGLAAAATLVGLALVPLFLQERGAVAVVVVLGIALLLDEVGIFLSVGFTAAEQMQLQAVVIVANRVLSTALAGVVVGFGGGLMAVALAYLGGSLGAVLVSAAFFKARLPPVHAADVSRAEMRDLLRQGAPFGIASFLNMAVFRLDAVLLQVLKGPVAVGLYGVAYRFFEPTLFVTWTISHAATPRLVREATTNTRGRTLELCMAATLAFYLPLAVSAPFAAHWVTENVFGEQYITAVDAILWLAAAAVPYAVAHLLRASAIASGLRQSIAFVAGSVLALNIVVNLALIPRYGVTGAAVATFVTEVAECIALGVLHVQRVARIRLTGAILAPMVAATFMAAVLWFLPRGAPALFAGAVAFVAALAGATRVLAPGDARSLIAALRGKEAT